MQKRSEKQEKQKVRLWQQRRSASFQASSRLDGLMVADITLAEQEITERLEALRRQYVP